MYPAVKSFAREHPTMVLTLSYVLITAIGTIYSFFFYGEFDINIIKFADLSDFLLVAILEPRSLFMFTFIVLLMLAAYWFDTLLRKRFKFYHNFVHNRMKAKYTDPIMVMGIVLLFTVIMMRDLAVKNAEQIKTHGKDSYQVMFSENGEEVSSKQLELLGSTSRFVYLYDQNNNKAVVIAPENIGYMRKSVTEKNTAKEAESTPKESDKNQDKSEKTK